MSLQPVAPGDRYIPWLGQCQANWHFKPLKYLCTLNARVLPEDTAPNEGIIYIDIGSVDSNGTWEASEPIPFSEAPSRARRILVDGDVLISTVRTYLRAITNVGKVDGNLICSTGFAVLSAGKGVDPRFLAYWVRSGYFIDEIVARSLGVSYPAINASDIGNLPFPVIPFGEQRAIAALLDRETQRIDTLIAKKQRQIELLQEKRAALISHAVTKGLDPNVKMKDSCVEWLGEIPSHWKERKLKYVASVVVSNVDKHSAEGEIPVHLCNYLNVYNNDFIGPDIDLMAATASSEEIAKFKITKGDVLVTKDSEDWRDIAVSAFVTSDMDGVLCGYHLAQIRPNTAIIDGKYLFRAFSASGINDQFKVAATGITRYGLGKYSLDSALFPVPPLDEQRAIAAFLDRETERIDVLISKVQQSIETLREYRSALISAAVTGKIDVREEASIL